MTADRCRITLELSGCVANTHGLEPQRSHDVPARLLGDAFGEPLCVVKVAPESLTDGYFWFYRF